MGQVIAPAPSARAVAREWVECIQREIQESQFERPMMRNVIERLGPDDEVQRIYEDEDWRVCLTYTFEVGKSGISRFLTGEERSITFECG